MGTFSIAMLVIVGLFLSLMVGMNVFVRARARAMTGKPLPELPGSVGASIAKAHSGLV